MKYAKLTFTYICIFRYFLYYLYLDPPFDLRVRDCSVNMCVIQSGLQGCWIMVYKFIITIVHN